MAGSLDGIIVADFSRVLAGPYATMLLSDLGATVIKVERPGLGDDTRSWGPPFSSRGNSTYFEGVNRNKLSITLDLFNSQDRKRALNLAKQSDILVENHRVGSLARFGLDYPQLKQLNSSLIYCSISGFGTQAGRELPGYDLLVQAMGGLMSITGESNPTKVGVALVDVVTGLHAAIGILAALHHRDATGHGQLIEINLLSALLSSMVNQSASYSLAGVIPHHMGNAHPSIAPYELFKSLDQDMVIAVGNDSQFTSLCRVLELDSLTHDPKFGTNSSRVENRNELRTLLQNRLLQKSAAEWFSLLTDAGVPSGPINNMEQAFALATNLGLSPIIDGQVANPLTLSETPIRRFTKPPGLGESSADIIRKFSLDD